MITTADLDAVAVVCPECHNDQAIYLGRSGGLRFFECAACGAEHYLQDRKAAADQVAQWLADWKMGNGEAA